MFQRQFIHSSHQTIPKFITQKACTHKNSEILCILNHSEIEYMFHICCSSRFLSFSLSLSFSHSSWCLLSFPPPISSVSFWIFLFGKNVDWIHPLTHSHTHTLTRINNCERNVDDWVHISRILFLWCLLWKWYECDGIMMMMIDFLCLCSYVCVWTCVRFSVSAADVDEDQAFSDSQANSQHEFDHSHFNNFRTITVPTTTTTTTTQAATTTKTKNCRGLIQKRAHTLDDFMEGKRNITQTNQQQKKIPSHKQKKIQSSV